MPCVHHENGMCQLYADVKRYHDDYPFLSGEGRCLRNASREELMERGIDPHDKCADYEYTPHGYTYMPPYRFICFDNEGASYDRYTVYILDFDSGEDTFLGMSSSPFHPSGFCQHSDGTLGDHLGNPIAFEDLPDDCQKAVMQNLTVDD